MTLAFELAIRSSKAETDFIMAGVVGSIVGKTFSITRCVDSSYMELHDRVL
jgi:hypothetical protein